MTMTAYEFRVTEFETRKRCNFHFMHDVIKNGNENNSIFE